MKILITGGAGFVGWHLAKLLSKDPLNKIYIVDDLSRGELDEDFSDLIKKDNVEFFNEDLRNIEALKKIGEIEFDYIYHCAAVCGTNNFYEKPYYTLSNNIQATINIIEAFKDSGAKFLFTSTSENYSGYENLEIPTPEVVHLSIADVFNPRWSYAGSKIVGEQLFIHAAKEYGIKYSIIRFHNIYGERMGYGHIIPGVIKRIFERQDPFEIISQNETRSFCYIEDGVSAMKKIMLSDKTNGKIINIGKNEEVEIGEIYKKIFALAKFNPENVIYKDSPEGSTSRRCPNVDLLKKLTGYTCETSLESGFHKTYEWYKKDLS